ncbi:hypothetical protein LOC68_23155 [Blastopirellula sp. JC732]|uniref:Uncharacterized protein n=1 Tax=Blastopirellula sediminis TaxID=2894196 RepID=A0A9X1SII4_9BACT|nr:hypothetical protein [Blastopirellula sediminis]MCC9605398.1 hypothetical protein [Blastopirellula sediminis]MCC9631302.1 hypothetical protein [Blastopirellula sediminis]
MCRRSSPTLLLAISAALFAILWSATPAWADRLILRNLEILNNINVVSLDEDGVNVEGQGIIGWDQIERGTVGNKQAEFDKLLKDLGGPLFRLRQRLSVGDYSGLSEQAEALFSTYAKRESETAYLVCQATMWSRQALGRPAAALEAYFRCLRMLRSKAGLASTLPGGRKLSFDTATGLSPELEPIFFDSAEAQAALPAVKAAAQDLQPPLPQAAFVYVGSLAISAGDMPLAEKSFENLRADNPLVADWRVIAPAMEDLTRGENSQAIVQLEARVPGMHPFNRGIAHYLLGKARTADVMTSAVEKGVLDFLYVPAIEGARRPELSAAALYDAMNALKKTGDTKQAGNLRKELLTNYSGAYFGQKLRDQINRGEDH